MIFPLLWLVTLLLTGLYALLAPALTLWRLLGAAALSFLAANLLFAVLLIFNWLLQPRLGPDEGVDRQRPLSLWACRSVARWLCGYAGVRPRFTGLEKLPEQPFLFVSNHRSLFDPLLVVGYLPQYNISFVAKPSIFKLSLLGQTARQAGHLAIDRENDRAALKTILQAADYLKRGVCSVGIYPEGTRNRGGEPLLPFHAGSFKIAQKAGVPVVVACTRDTEKIHKTLFVYPTPVYLDVLEVIDAERVKSMKTVELAEYARRLLTEKLEEDRP